MTIELRDEDRAILTRWVKSRAVGDKQTVRVRIVLMTADGCSTQEIMETLKVSNPTLNFWRRRYLECGIEGLKKGKTRPSRVPPLSVEKVQEVLTLTLAHQVRISRMAVHRIWREHKLKPHRVKGFKVSNDPQFEEKLWDVVGLYLDPPEKAIVFSVDEKSQSQGLDCTQPGLPMKPGKNGTLTHDYKRHGTTTLFAALNVHDGTVMVNGVRLGF